MAVNPMIRTRWGGIRLRIRKQVAVVAAAAVVSLSVSVSPAMAKEKCIFSPEDCAALEFVGPPLIEPPIQGPPLIELPVQGPPAPEPFIGPPVVPPKGIDEPQHRLKPTPLSYFGVTDITGAVAISVDGKICSVPRILSRNGHTLVPVRALSDCLGLDVDWWQDTGSVIISGGIGENRQTTLRIDARSESPIITDMGALTQLHQTQDDHTYNLGWENRPFLYDGTTYLPFRAVTDIFKVRVDYSPGTPNMVTVDTSKPPRPYPEQAERAFDFLYMSGGRMAIDPAIYRTAGLYPAAVDHLESFVDAVNWYTSENPGGSIGYSPVAKRFTISDTYGQIDIYPTHYVRWAHSREDAVRYMNDLSGGPFIYDVVTGVAGFWAMDNADKLAELAARFGLIGAGTVAAASEVIATAGVVVGVGSFAIDGLESMTVDRLQSCLDSAKKIDEGPGRARANPYLGWVFSENGISCVPSYRSGIIDVDGSVLS